MPHSWHLGFLAVQTYRPCRMSQWWALPMSSGGKFATRVFSVTSGFGESSVSPIRFETRNT